MEVPREKWDEADPATREGDDSMDVSLDHNDRTTRNVLPDWTRMSLTPGAAPSLTPTPNPLLRSSPRTQVGA